MCPPISTACSERPRSVHHWLPRLVDLRLDRQSSLPTPSSPRLHPGVRPGDALGAVLVAGQLLQLAQLGDGAARVERHRAHEPKLAQRCPY